MDKINCNITIEGGTAEGNFRRYDPGSSINGRVQLIPNEDINSRSAAVRLQWRTEGRGDPNGATFQETQIWQGNLQKGRPVEHQFQFQIPMEPWSYSGHYITIVWEILVYVDVPLAGDPKFSQPFIVRPQSA